MSLINKVLTDLDQRGASNGHSNSELEDSAALNGLPFSPVPNKKTNQARYVIISGAIIIVLAIGIGAGYVLFNFAANEDTVASVMPSAGQDNRSVAINKEKSKPDNKIDTNIKVKQVATVEPPKAKKTNNVVRSKPKKKVTAEPKIAIAKSKPKDTVLPHAEFDAKSEFNKSARPMRLEQRAEVAYQTAYDLLRERKIRKAESSLRQALALEPSHVKARELLSGVYIKQGRWVEASELLRNGLSMSPGHSTFSKLYARALMQLKQDKLAIGVLQRHAPHINSDPEYYAILAALYQRQKDHVSAAKMYQKIVEIQPRNGVWWVGLGISLEALGESQQASQAYSQARKTGNLQKEIAHFTNNRLVALDEIGYPN